MLFASAVQSSLSEICIFVLAFGKLSVLIFVTTDLNVVSCSDVD